MVITGAWALGRSDGGSQVAPPPAAAPANSEAVAPPPSVLPTLATVWYPFPIPRDSTSGAFRPLPAFATDPGYSVYLRGFRENGLVSQLDLSTGELTDLDVGNGSIYGVVPVDGTAALLGWASGGFEAPLADGTSWYFDGDDLVRHALLDPGAELERLEYEPAGQVGFGGLNGVTAAGRPTVVRADGRTYEVASDGSMRRLAEGSVTTVDRGRYAEQVCTAEGSCTTVLHGGAVARYEFRTLSDGRVVQAVAGFGTLEPFDTVSFSPDGRFASMLTVRTGTWTLVELGGAGRVVELVGPGSAERMASEPTSASVGWSPDSRYFFFMADGLVVVDTLDASVARVLPDPESVVSILGVA